MKNQVNHLLPVALMLLLGGMTFWLQYAIESSPPTESANKSHVPDAIGKKVAIARLNLQGVTQYHLRADSMAHFPDDDSMELTAPRFIKNGIDAEFTVTANRGVVNQEIKEARFYDNVQLVRRPLSGDSLQIHTQYMQVFMELGIARTDRAVTIVNGTSTLSGTGMEYERDTGRLSLLSAVKGSFHVQKN